MQVVLGLVAMATTVDNLYASMKALVCIVGNNQVALREMERTGGFKVQLVYLYIFHTTFFATFTPPPSLLPSPLPPRFWACFFAPNLT